MNKSTSVSLDRYSSYKESGVKWIGTIPSHWKIEKGKWLFTKESRPVRPKDEAVTCFRDGEVTLRRNRRTEGFTNALQEHGYQGIRKGDLVIHAMDAFAGAVGVSDSDGKSTPVYSVCTERFEGTVNQYFYAYFLRNLALNGIILALAKGIRERSTDFRYNDFGDLELVLPPLPEQTAIANFLDEKTAQIDQAIAQKERLIALLEERKQIIIQQAVTKGLDPTVEMRDSGVEWIGQVPKHWEVKRIGHFAKVGNGSTPNRSNNQYWSKGTFPWFNSSKVNEEEIESSDQFVTMTAIKECHLPIIDSGTVLMAITGEGKTRGMVAISRIRATINQHLAYITVDNRIALNSFVVVMLKSMYHKLRSDSSGQGSTKGAITCDYIKRIQIPLPPLVEQIAICKKMSEKGSLAKRAIKIQQSQITKLKEYKATLIDSAVTGKIKVS